MGYADPADFDKAMESPKRQHYPGVIKVSARRWCPVALTDAYVSNMGVPMRHFAAVGPAESYDAAIERLAQLRGEYSADH